jgi:hypothetical protein
VIRAAAWRARFLQRRSHAIAVALVCVGPAVPLRATLEWESTTVRRDAPAGASHVEAEFHFTNRGPTAVRISDLRSSCGCTVPALDKDVFEPGESGRIRAVYHVGSKDGLQTESVSVTTDEGRPEPHVLTLEVNVQIPLRIVPRLLHWRVGDDPKPKELRLVLDAGWHVEALDSNSDRFSVELVTGADGATFARVAPVDTWARGDARIAVKVAKGDDEPVVYLAVVRVL